MTFQGSIPTDYINRTSDFVVSRQARRHLNLLRNAICYNQEELIQYVFLASEINRRIKLLSDADDLNIPKLENALNELKEILVLPVREVYKKNFEFLLSYFSERSNTLPRICIKVLQEDQTITTLIRDRKYKEKSNPSHKDENIATLKTEEGQKYYLCNDIPQYIKKDLYKNERINRDVVKMYSEPPSIRDGEYDWAWVDCWQKVPMPGNLSVRIIPPPETCYKSTLVIPMALHNGNLHKRFKEIFEINDEIERTVYGFLCLDHTEKLYFQEQPDSDITYIFADLMSLFLVCQLRYAKYSDLFYKAKKIIDRNKNTS